MSAMLDWGKYIQVPGRLQYKAKAWDREDLNHDIVVAMAETQKVKDSNNGADFTNGKLPLARIYPFREQDGFRYPGRCCLP